jgi:Ca2+:H+ antiporter
MVVASVSLIIPATVYTTLPDSKPGLEDNITAFSLGTAVILLVLYVLYLYFQLKPHASFFNEVQQAEEDVEERRQGQMLPPIAAGIALAVVIVFVAVCAGFLIGSIDPIVETMHISKTFIGLVLLPILGNGTERITAVIVAYQGRMDLAINVVIGSSMQIALFIASFLVILSWGMHTPDHMTLFFQDTETIIFFLSVLAVKSLIEDGKSNYLEGAMCLGT